MEVNPAFTSYISAFTSGTISNQGVIRIRLVNELPSGDALAAVMKKDLFSFSPKIEGEAVAGDERTIEFRPAEKLRPGTAYSATFRLGAVMQDLPQDLKEFRFSFKTIRQSFTVNLKGMSPYNNRDLRRNMATGMVQTADYIEGKNIEKILSATQEGKKLPVSWDHDPDGKMHYFTIDSIHRSEDKSSVQVSWNGSGIDVDNSGSRELQIPSLADFTIMDISVVQQPDQFILLRFSDPLLAKQYLDGLIHMENGTDLQFTIENNEVRAFPSVRQTGQLNVIVESGIRNISGFRLRERQHFELSFEEVKPAVRLTGKGVILPGSEGLVFPFESVNLKAVDVTVVRIFENNVSQFLQVNHLDGSDQLKRVGRLLKRKTLILRPDHPIDFGNWNTFFIDLGDLIKSEPGAIYRVEIGFRRSYSLYPCSGSEPISDEALANEISEEEFDYSEDEDLSYWDSYENAYEDGYWGYGWEERDDPCSDHYYGQRRSVARNILASDLGIIAKQGNDKSMVFAVTDLVTTGVLSGVDLEVYNYQRQLLASARTDDKGLARVGLSNVPFLLVAKYGDQRGYLRLDDGSSLSLSRFDVSGSVVEKGLKGFIYGERGVWRPGDSLYLSFILEDKSNSLPKQHPVSFELYNPNQQLVYKSVKTSGLNGFYTFSTATSPEAPTGNWMVKIKVGGATFNKRVRIETVKPNRLKINLDFGTPRLSASEKGIKGTLEASWLHGAVADRLKADVALSFSQVPTVFKEYSEYKFDDPVRNFYPTEYYIFQGRLDSDGKAEFHPDLSMDAKPPGMLRANFKTRVFEESGEFSVDRFSLPYSPYESYVGIKTPKGDKARGMLLVDTTHTVDIVTLDADGNPVSRNDVEVSLVKIRWRWWWDASYENLASYVGTNQQQTIVSKKINTRRGRGEFKFKVEYPSWGRYLVRAIDPVSGHASGKIIYIDWPGWAGRAQRENPGGAAMLTFSTDKSSYTVGEKAVLTFPSTDKGRALFSLENGSGVVKADWIETSEPETHYSFEVTEEMSPNVYIHLSLVQPHAQSVNDLPIRLYGIMPVLVEDPGTRLHPVISMPDELRPNSRVNIRVNEVNGLECVYTLALVDEGLLGLTRFGTPDAWSHFYAREALGVRTWDVYDMVIGAYGARIESLMSIGGGMGEEGEGGEARNLANRFPPMVIFKGPFLLKQGKSRTHSLEIPNYIGAVRAMVVAGNQGAYGSADKSLPVRQPVMALATLPRVLGPGESFSLPVTIFAMDDKVRNVKVDLSTNELLLPADGTNRQVTFNRPGDKMVDFTVRVPSAIGIGKAEITAVSGNEKSVYTAELNIRNPNPPVTDFLQTTIEGGSNWQGTYTLPGMAGTNSAVLEVSSIPPINLGKRLKFLLNYPHGCIEQTTSSVFPQLYLKDLVDLPEEKAKKTETNIKAGIKRLEKFVLPDGSFGYWPNSTQSSEWGTNYAGHFLLEARNKGYYVRSDIMNNWLRFQKKTARRSGSNGKNDLIQAYRLYTLALANQPVLSAMNRLRENSTLSAQAKWRLAAAYALCGQAEVARELVRSAPKEIAAYNGFNNSYGSRERDWAMILETLVQIDDRAEGADYVRKISEALSGKHWMSTQTTAYCLLSVAKFAGHGDLSSELSFEYSHNGGRTVKARSDLPLVQVDLEPGRETAGNLDIRNTTNGILFARVIMTGVPAAGNEEAQSNRLNLELNYTDLEGKPIDVSDIRQGSDFYMHVRINNPGTYGNYKDMALTQILPSGWEIRNTRLDEVPQLMNANLPKYIDIRDDRVLSYFDLDARQTKTFVLQLNASYKGRFYLPAVLCEAMYENTVNARSRGKWVEVH